jgi:hypothetical protein
MLKLVHISNHRPQSREINKSHQFVNQKLKLVVSNSSPASSQKPTISNSSAAPSCFTVEVWPRGPNLYEMHLKDSAHSLKCDFTLEIEESFDAVSPSSVVCYFPNIDQSALNDFVEEDETLFGMFMIQFQMKILEQLFLFCANHYASNLVIFVDDAQANDLGIYRDFLTYKDETITPDGEKTEMIIPADRETYDQWIDFMEEVDQKFRQTLWREQKSNFSLRQYLKSHAVLKF